MPAEAPDEAEPVKAAPPSHPDVRLPFPPGVTTTLKCCFRYP